MYAAGFDYLIGNEIDRLASRTGASCKLFRHQLYAAKLSVASAGNTSALSFTIPDNYCFILTRLALESIPPVNDPSLSTFDWRGPDPDGDGLSRAYFTVKNKPNSPVTNTGYAPINRPLAIVFSAGDLVAFWLNRTLSNVPANEVVTLVAEGYMAPPTVRECFEGETHFLLPDPPATSATGVVATLILNTLKVIDARNEAAPAVLATVAVGTQSGDDDTIFVSGSTCFTLGNDDTLYAVNITDTAAPVILSSTPCDRAGSGFYRMAVKGNYLLIVRSSNVPFFRDTLEVFNISNLAAPVSVASYNLNTGFAAPQNGGGMLLDGNTLVITGEIGHVNAIACMGFYNVSSLPTITQIGVVQTETDPSSLDLLDLADHIAYCAVSLPTGVELKIYDVTIPGSPALLGSLALPTDVIVFSQLSSDYIYGVTLSTLDKKIYALDVSNPAAPALAGSTAVTTNRNFSIRAYTDSRGPRVYLATRKNSTVPRNRTVQIYDATAPAALALLGQVIYSTAGGNTQLAIAIGVL